jgi:tetratricopeptide (TPR) repeat protein
VLLVGLALGGAWVFWWRKKGGGSKSRGRDRELLVADLEARQALLYEQLREAREGEREELELAAARNLKALEEAGGGVTQSSGADEESADVAAAPAAPLSAAHGPRAWLGFVGGVACAGLVGLLIVWAQRDAQPRMEPGVPPPATADEPHPGPQLDQRAAEALEQIALQVESDPTDLMARKQYAVGLLSTGQFFAAFEQAEILLASNERDPDGLYVKGMVRMRMGQEAEARVLLEGLTSDYPDHVPALTALGVLALRGAGLSVAEEYWQQALAASGGSNPEVERLMATAREQLAAGAGQAASAPARPAPTQPAPPPAQGPAYTVVLDVPAGAVTPPNALLFVSVRAGDVGPPAAARRISNPRFPMTVTLSAANSMMGQPLPEAGTVLVRLDADGNVSTRQEGELTAEVEMQVGETVSATLQ